MIQKDDVKQEKKRGFWGRLMDKLIRRWKKRPRNHPAVAEELKEKGHRAAKTC